MAAPGLLEEEGLFSAVGDDGKDLVEEMVEVDDPLVATVVTIVVSVSFVEGFVDCCSSVLIVDVEIPVMVAVDVVVVNGVEGVPEVDVA